MKIIDALLEFKVTWRYLFTPWLDNLCDEIRSAEGGGAERKLSSTPRCLSDGQKDRP